MPADIRARTTGRTTVRPGNVLAIAICALFAVLLAPDPAPAQAPPSPQQAQGAVSNSIVIRGNRRIEAGTIFAYMDLPTDRTITGEDLNAATRRLFDTGLFRDVRVTPASDGRLIVEVQENPSISVISFEGNDNLTDEDLSGIIASRPRFPFTPASAEADAQAVINIYRRTGRYGAQVTPVVIERSENRVDLVFEIEEGDLTGIKSIDFVGNKAFSDSRLRDEIETTETSIFSVFFSTDIYDPDRTELDGALLRQFYLSRGYADFTILSTVTELAPDRSGFFITFILSEGEKYTFGEFDVLVTAEGLDPAIFLEAIPAEDLIGETYNADTVEELANTLTNLAGELGFAFVQVQPRANKDAEARTIDIVFELIEGPRVFIERIDIEGNVQTLDRVIRREIELVEGDPFDARKIREARRAIRGLDFFERVDVETEPGSADDRAVLKVAVEEKSTGAISLGLGFASSVGPIGSVTVRERNFLGRGQEVDVRVTAAGDTQVYDLGFTEPRFLDRDVLAGFRLFFIQDNREDQSQFRINRLGLTPRVGFPLSPNTDLELRYTISRDDLTASPFASPAIQIDDGDRIESVVGYRLFHDKRNDQIEPTAGYLGLINQEIAGLGGDARYLKTRASIKGWTGFLGDEVIASSEFEAGALVSFGQDSNVSDRFFLGNDSFRGFAREGIGPRDQNTNDALGGNYFAILRNEVSFPLGLPEELGVYGGLFVDVGTLWSLNQTDYQAINFAPAVRIDDEAKLRVSGGALLFVETPFGPLELGVGFPIVQQDDDEDEIFRLSVGTRF